MEKINKKNLKQIRNDSKNSHNFISSELLKYIKIILIITILFLVPNKSLSNTSENMQENELVNTDVKTLQRVNEIRNSKNTDISQRTGKVFYVSSTGNDDNDGLSPEKAWKTLEKVNTSFDNNIINETDTILLKRGDKFRGNIKIKACEILIGSYGDENLEKPEIIVSTYDGAIDGEWINVDNNIWKYTINGENPFNNDVGVIWFHSNNDVASNIMENIDGSFEYGKKVTTYKNIDEISLDIKTIIDEDLEFYHVGHACSGENTGKELYVYSEQNPKDRFDRIEFAIAEHGIRVSSFTNAIIDNITIKYAGMHGISAGTIANLKVTNCEFGYIGGAVQNYGMFSPDKPTRFGNAIEIYGSITEKNGYDVEEGFVVQNNYIYQVYDAGITFQYTTEDESQIENAIFDNNVIEYCNYNIEYWNTSKSTDTLVQENTYINNYEITNNIMRYAGIGVSQTRPDKGQSAHIKTWAHNTDYDNYVKGKYIISNNIFDTSTEQVFWIYASDEKSLPEIINNTFYNSYSVQFGYYYAHPTKYVIPYIKNKLEEIFPNNTFKYLENDLDSYSCSGVTGEVNWNYNNDTGILYIKGSGKMQDYTQTELPEWYRARMFIKKVIIDEDVTYIGKYAFYDLPYVEEIEINCKELENFSHSGTNIGDNYAFYKTGSSWLGMDVTIGENVTVIPEYMFWPATESREAPYVKSLNFKGNNVKEIRNHAFQNLRTPVVVIPDGVEIIGTLAIANSSFTIAISVPDSVKRIDSWAFAGNTKLEKIVFGKNISTISEYMLSGSRELKDVIFQSNIEFNSSNYKGLFSSDSTDTIIFGDDSVSTIVNNYCISTNTNNIKFENSNEYKININSNTDLIEFQNDDLRSIEHKADKDIIFYAKPGYKIDDINVYNEYKTTNGNVYRINKVSISNVDDVYTIPSSYWDIYIDATVSKIEVKEDPEEEKENTDEEDKENVDEEDKENVEEENKENVEEENKENVDEENKENIDEEDKENVDEEDKGNVDEEDKGNVDEDDKGNVDEDDKGNVDEEDKENVDEEDNNYANIKDDLADRNLPFTGHKNIEIIIFIGICFGICFQGCFQGHLPKTGKN